MSDPMNDIDSVGPAKRLDARSWIAGWERVLAWLKARERWVLLATVAFQVVVLTGMIAGKLVPLRTGDVVLLRVEPVDPRDLFRGDYVILGYEISRVPPQGIAGLSAPRTMSNAQQWQGRAVYVALEPESDGLHYRGGPVSTVPPPPGTRFIEGALADSRRITFGIESYFVQEGKGKAYEAAIRNHRLWAEVAVTPTGRAALRGLRIE